MGKAKRSGYVFLSWIGDHLPKHVHVYKNKKLVVKWDIENWKSIKGAATKTILKLIKELLEDGSI